MHYKGSCHCSAVSFAVEGDLSGGAVACNCSICSRKGAYLWCVPLASLTVTAPEYGLGSSASTIMSSRINSAGPAAFMLLPRIAARPMRRWPISMSAASRILILHRCP